MKAPVLMWVFFFGAVSLQLVFSMVEEDERIQDLHEVESDSDDLQEDEQLSVQKRHLIQFARMIRCATRRNPLDYGRYGNWCGFGGGGKPVDGVDRCCKSHDKCYERARAGCKNPKWIWYRYRTRRKRYFFRYRCRITCRNRWGSCRRKVCECDKIAALCFARNRYHQKYKKGLFG